MSDRKRPLIVALSGGGRTLENLLKHQDSPSSKYQVTGVISSKPNIRGVSIAQDAGLRVFVGTFRKDEHKQTADKLLGWLAQEPPSLIALGGFLAPFPIYPNFENRVVNIHPSLLPKFGGKGMYGSHVHKAVIQAGEPFSGATVHMVTEKYDEGKILGQVRIKVGTRDAETLARAVFEAECDLYPRIINRIIGMTSSELSELEPLYYDRLATTSNEEA